MCQSAENSQKFEAADIHGAAKSTSLFFPQPQTQGGRYRLKNATMVDLVRTAYGFGADKVVGGPNWLELDRFDVTAKVPEGATTESLKAMLQTLLADRFKLVVHKDTRPVPVYVLAAGKKPQLKEADGTGETGCKAQSSTAPAGEGRINMMMGNADGTSTRFVLGPGMTVQYACRNMTMAAFVEGLRNMMGANVGPNPVLDQTGLTGKWNFDLSWSISLLGGLANDTAKRVSLPEAIDKQLGLKLEEQPIPTPVLVVDSVKRTPTGNPPETAELLPPIPLPTEFEVASVKAFETGTAPRRMGFQMQPGGRFTSEGMPLGFVISRAFNTNNNNEIVGLPGWVNSERYDIIAKTPASGAHLTIADNEALAPMLKALLVDRFKLTYHTEERPVTTYNLVAVKPKMKKADPESRIFCKNGEAPAGSPRNSRALICQNVTMALFAERLRGLTSDLSWPITDATELEGGWDFTLVYSPMGQMMFATGAGGGRGSAADSGEGGAALPTASEPTDTLTIFTALEKQLGLKLASQKRPMPVIVIDHIEQKPTEN
jgi:uncharacterized protein (TIGR03435 family)